MWQRAGRRRRAHKNERVGVVKLVCPNDESHKQFIESCVFRETLVDQDGEVIKDERGPKQYQWECAECGVEIKEE